MAPSHLTTPDGWTSATSCLAHEAKHPQRICLNGVVPSPLLRNPSTRYSAYGTVWYDRCGMMRCGKCQKQRPSAPRQRTGLALRSATGRRQLCLLADLAYRRCAGALHPIVLVRCNVVQRLPLPLVLTHERDVWTKLGTALMLHRCCTRFERYMVRRGGRACCE